MENTTNAQCDLSTDVHRSRRASDMDNCAICLDRIQDKKTLKCHHSFCTECIDSVFKFKPACPICNTYHGIYIGTQPEGTMTVTRRWQSLPGFEHCQTIVIEYRFPSGIQGPEHPNPGVKYASTSRTAFLPACEEGERVLRLLRKAFDRRLTFTVGRSATTGLNNAITWNDIHHKTNMGGGPQYFGYPDPEYLSRVQEELRLNGVTEDD
ncbi:putative E3 ubiquitin-protein ligase DTX3 [Centroberyx gerrardi]|uniref:probable E3 ubiquitin-protein ligase DTX3 n=1 Tax=Centroberyx gerrardi TaxID=166262 RepID=UPI003AAB116D